MNHSLLGFDRLVHDVLRQLSRLHGVRLHKIEPEVAEFLEAFPWRGSPRAIKRQMCTVLVPGIRAARKTGVLRAKFLPGPAVLVAIRVQNAAQRAEMNVPASAGWGDDVVEAPFVVPGLRVRSEERPEIQAFS